MNKYTPFEIYNWITDAPIKPGLKVTLLALARFMDQNKNGLRVWPGQELIAEKTGLKRRQVFSNLKQLKALGYIQIEHRNVGKGYRAPCEYVLNIGHVHESPCAVFAHPHGQSTTANVSQTAHEGDCKKGPYRKKIEKEGTSPSVSAVKQTPVGIETPEKEKEKGKVLVRNFRAQCRINEAARIRFYMDCGRLHTRADQFHKPKNPNVPLSANNIKTLNLWFEQLPESGCDVMQYAMENWPRIYAEIPAWSNFRNKNPLISALDKYGHRELLDSWKAFQQKASLSRVAANTELQELAA